jgi:hypothetical protein
MPHRQLDDDLTAHRVAEIGGAIDAGIVRPTEQPFGELLDRQPPR